MVFKNIQRAISHTVVGIDNASKWTLERMYTPALMIVIGGTKLFALSGIALLAANFITAINDYMAGMFIVETRWSTLEQAMVSTNYLLGELSNFAQLIIQTQNAWFTLAALAFIKFAHDKAVGAYHERIVDPTKEPRWSN